jgi:DNA polymerase-4
MPLPTLPPLNWLFVDMNSYFASAEQHLRPELRGKPVGVIPVESEGSCLIAASVEAKSLGLRMGTRVQEARLQCPNIQLVRARPDVYVRLHHEIAKSIDRWAPIHKAYSVDEWALRLGRGQYEPDEATALGQNIKDQIYSDFSPTLGCSVGVAATRLLAKIACDLNKPDGLTVLEIENMPGQLEGLEPEDLCGIGRGIATRLERHGIRTVRQLWELNRRQAGLIWGSVSGVQWWNAFHGYDEPEVPTRKKSMGHENVLEPKHRNETGARGILIRLVSRLGIRLRTDGYVAGAIGINISFSEGPRFAASMDLPQIQDTRTLLESLNRLLDRCPAMRSRPIKVGAVVYGLVQSTQLSGNLFVQADREIDLSHTMDTINNRWGLASIYYGSMHEYRHHMDDKIAFGRIPPAVTPDANQNQTH